MLIVWPIACNCAVAVDELQLTQCLWSALAFLVPSCGWLAIYWASTTAGMPFMGAFFSLFIGILGPAGTCFQGLWWSGCQLEAVNTCVRCRLTHHDVLQCL
jgi:hypothetical protein